MSDLFPKDKDTLDHIVCTCCHRHKHKKISFKQWIKSLASRLQSKSDEKRQLKMDL